MARLSKTSLFKTAAPRAETAMEKTTRLVRDILDDEAEVRRLKTARLRKARLEEKKARRTKAPRQNQRERARPPKPMPTDKPEASRKLGMAYLASPHTPSATHERLPIATL